MVKWALRCMDTWEDGARVIRWVVVNGATGGTVGRFQTHDSATAWLERMHFKHTDNSAGESRAEIWTKEASR